MISLRNCVSVQVFFNIFTLIRVEIATDKLGTCKDIQENYES